MHDVAIVGGGPAGLLTARRCAEAGLDVLLLEEHTEGFQAGRLDAEFLARYESRWAAELGADLRVSAWLRQFLTRCRDAEIDELIRALASDSVQAVIHRTASFNRHRNLILALLREPGIASLLLKSFFR